MKALLLLCFVLYADAQLVDLSKGLQVHLGPYDISAHIGNATNRYLPLTTDDIVSSTNARNLLQEVRRLFKVGFNVLPPLDPYKRSSLPPFSLDHSLKLVKGDVLLHNLVLVGAQRFQLNSLELRLKTGRVDFEFSLNKLNLDVDFQTDVVLAELLPLHLKGHLSLLLSGVKIVGNVHVVPKLIGKNYYYQVVALHYHVHIEDVAVQLLGTNVNLNKVIKDSLLLGIDLLNDILPPRIFAKLTDDFNTYAAKIVLQQANSMLLIANTEQVLAYLLPELLS